MCSDESILTDYRQIEAIDRWKCGIIIFLINVDADVCVVADVDINFIKNIIVAAVFYGRVCLAIRFYRIYYHVVSFVKV